MSIQINLFRSQLKHTRDFKRKGIKFGWKHVQGKFLRDEKRVEMGKGRRADIEIHAKKA